MDPLAVKLLYFAVYMPLVTRLGPIELEDRADAFVYIELRDGAICNMTIGDGTSDVLRQIACAAASSEPLQCSFELGRLGKPLGYEVVPIPTNALATVAGYALGLAAGELHSTITPAELLRDFGHAAAAYARAAPWKHWGENQDFAVTTSGRKTATFELWITGSPPGLSLTNTEAPHEELVVALRDSMQRFARHWVKQAFGLQSLPIAGRVSGDDFLPVEPGELMILTAALRALASLSPCERQASAKVEWSNQCVGVEVEAPAPEVVSQK